MQTPKIPSHCLHFLFPPCLPWEGEAGWGMGHRARGPSSLVLALSCFYTSCTLPVQLTDTPPHRRQVEAMRRLHGMCSVAEFCETLQVSDPCLANHQHFRRWVKLISKAARALTLNPRPLAEVPHPADRPPVAADMSLFFFSFFKDEQKDFTFIKCSLCWQSICATPPFYPFLLCNSTAAQLSGVLKKSC